MEDLHNATFEWPHPEPSTVIVTGSFDQWSSSVHLSRTDGGFTGSTKIPWGGKVTYKFIVDGNWVIHGEQPTETDPAGNVNNVYTAPEKPAAKTNGSTKPTVVETVKEAIHVNGVVDKLPEVPQATAKDFANTVAATDGTTSALDYVASGVGYAIQGVIGVDPINADQIALATPKSATEFAVPEAAEKAAEPVVLPDVPIVLTPVNSTEPDSPATPIAEPTPSETKPAEVGNTHIPLISPVAPALEKQLGPVPVEPPAVADAPPIIDASPVAVVSPIPVPAETAPPVVNTPELKVPEETAVAPEVPEKVATEAPAPVEPSAPVPPTTPPKQSVHSFPSTESPSTIKGSPASSKTGTTASRKKRTSIFGKISLKGIFGDKEKEKK